jgi:uroporphyrinogen-III synthase
VLAEALPDAAAQALAAGEIDGVLHFSRRSAEAYLACCRRAGLAQAALAPRQYCLAVQVAEPLAAAGAAQIRIAERPEEPGLLELLVS